MSDFTGKVGLVTGAGSGIGRASAMAFAVRGAAVGVLDIDKADALATVRLIEQAGGRAIPVVTDVGDQASVQSAVSQVVDTLGGLDFAHNNAGIQGIRSPLSELDLDDWERVLRVNLTGVALCMKFELAIMAPQGGGAIVNTSSSAGLYGLPGMPAYVASKHGVVGLSKAAAVDYAKYGIRVNCLCPASTMTPMLEAVTSGTDILAGTIAATPLGRLAEAEEIAEAAVWLCSSEASYVTALTMSMDGARRV